MSESAYVDVCSIYCTSTQGVTTVAKSSYGLIQMCSIR